jgi:hypothetical protein
MEGNAVHVMNTASETLVCVLHPFHDKFQLSGRKHSISSHQDLLISLGEMEGNNLEGNHTSSSDGEDQLPLSFCHLHIYRLGLFNLISFRTRLSAGYGFRIQSGLHYSISLRSSPDSDGNRCQLTCRELDDEPMRSTIYYFGDMLLKPSVRHLALLFRIPSIAFDPNIYRDYLNHRNGRHMSFHDTSFEEGREGDRDSEIITHAGGGAVEFDERELWGIFFDQMYYIGIWGINPVGAPTAEAGGAASAGMAFQYLTIDEIESQEPFLYIGLPAVSLLNMILRSRYDTSPNSMPSLRLIDGRVVSEKTCPESYRPMFQILLQTKQAMCQLELPIQEQEIAWLRETLLYAGSERSLKGPSLVTRSLLTLPLSAPLSPSSHLFLLLEGGDCGIPVERQETLNRLFSSVVSISTQLTQQKYFKENFFHVLENISLGENLKR